MLTRRDIKVALAAAVITLTGAGMMRAQTPVMGSRIFEWDALKVEKTKVGARATSSACRPPRSTSSRCISPRSMPGRRRMRRISIRPRS